MDEVRKLFKYFKEIKERGEVPILVPGMGVWISNHYLVREFALLGQSGILSGVALEHIFLRRLLKRDADLLRAMRYFPNQEIVQEVMEKFCVPEGKDSNKKLRYLPLFTQKPSQLLQKVVILANFCEVWLAKRGHNQPIGINYLAKVEMPMLYAFYGAMLAGVDYIVVGAGHIPKLGETLKKLKKHKEVELELHVVGAPSDKSFKMRFNPVEIMGKSILSKKLVKPLLFLIFSSNTLAIRYGRNKDVDGIQIEIAKDAGGHIGSEALIELNLIMEKLKKPIIVTGGFADQAGYLLAKEFGVAAIGAGTISSHSRNAGFTKEIKHQVYEAVKNGKAMTRINSTASPTGFDFRELVLEGTLSQEDVLNKRVRGCRFGCLRTVYYFIDEEGSGSLGYRCPAEPINIFTGKGGDIEKARYARCLCATLIADTGHGDPSEPIYITAGTHINDIQNLINDNGELYTAEDVVNWIMGRR